LKLNTLERAKSKKMLFTKVLALVLGTFIVFNVGVGVGRGTISFGRDALFRKSVSKGLPPNLDYSSVEQMYDVLRRDFDGQLDASDLLDGLRQGLAKASGDRYTEYLNAEEAKDFDEDLSGSFSGIGAELSKDKNAVIIVAPLSGYPAEKAGLKSRDIITEINGETAYDLGVSEAVAKIRGPIGTKVKLKVIRDSSQELDFEIMRQQIDIPSVEWSTQDGNIGYLKISRFGEDTEELTQKAAQEFSRAGVKGVVVDLRSNPGGLLDASVVVASHWLPKGKTVLQEKRDGVIIRDYKSKGFSTLQGIPTVVLIDEGSASASEILAGALKDNGAATLLGMKTFGKGSVQQLEPLPDGGVLKVTIARWYTPGGKNIDKEGIEPDQKVERTADDAKAGKDPQKDAALTHLKKL
jgi:carboxyl-terminal processing protease